jgi:hypothetical protein
MGLQCWPPEVRRPSMLDDLAGSAVVRGGGSTLHAVTLVRWLGELEVPGPVCHVGVSGGETAALRPTTTAVNCRRCLRSLGLEEEPGQPDPSQQLILLLTQPPAAARPYRPTHRRRLSVCPIVKPDLTGPGRRGPPHRAPPSLMGFGSSGSPLWSEVSPRPARAEAGQLLCQPVAG